MLFKATGVNVVIVVLNVIDSLRNHLSIRFDGCTVLHIVATDVCHAVLQPNRNKKWNRVKCIHVRNQNLSVFRSYFHRYEMAKKQSQQEIEPFYFVWHFRSFEWISHQRSLKNESTLKPTEIISSYSVFSASNEQKNNHELWNSSICGIFQYFPFISVHIYFCLYLTLCYSVLAKNVWVFFLRSFQFICHWAVAILLRMWMCASVKFVFFFYQNCQYSWNDDQ